MAPPPLGSSPRVVIIGAGIGGASCAYHLKKQVPGAKVTILEARDRIGGRIKDTEFFGQTVNEGAGVYNCFQRNIIELVNELDVPTVHLPARPLGDGQFVWDGHRLSRPVELLKDDQSALAALEATVKEFLAALAANYRAQDEGAFVSVAGFLAAGGLGLYVRQSGEALFRNTPVSEAIQKYFLEPHTRVFFGQGLSASAMLSVVSLAGTFEDAFRTKGGMSKLVGATINATDCDLQLNSPVTMVTKMEAGTFEVTHGQKESHVTTPADVVVIAAPLEYTGIDFKGFKSDPAADQPSRRWQRLYFFIFYVAAKSVRPSYFGESAESGFNPSFVGTTATTSRPWVAIREAGSRRGTTVYAVYSSQDVSQTGLLQELFEGVEEFTSHEWGYSYPVDPPMGQGSAYQSIVLDDRLYSLNGLESVATQMEMSVTGGRNIAKLITKEV